MHLYKSVKSLAKTDKIQETPNSMIGIPKSVPVFIHFNEKN